MNAMDQKSLSLVQEYANEFKDWLITMITDGVEWISKMHAEMLNCELATRDQFLELIRKNISLEEMLDITEIVEKMYFRQNELLTPNTQLSDQIKKQTNLAFAFNIPFSELDTDKIIASYKLIRDIPNQLAQIDQEAEKELEKIDPHITNLWKGLRMLRRRKISRLLSNRDKEMKSQQTLWDSKVHDLEEKMNSLLLTPEGEEEFKRISERFNQALNTVAKIYFAGLASQS